MDEQNLVRILEKELRLTIFLHEKQTFILDTIILTNRMGNKNWKRNEFEFYKNKYLLEDIDAKYNIAIIKKYQK